MEIKTIIYKYQQLKNCRKQTGDNLKERSESVSGETY